jgi:hypothetical protein
VTEEEAWKVTAEKVKIRMDLDKEKGTIRTEEQYEGWANGFTAGLLFADSLPIERHAFGVVPSAYIRVIVGLGASIEMDKGAKAHAMMVSAECKGETDREGLLVILGSALAAITAYAQNLSPAFDDKKKFSEDLTDISENGVNGFRARMNPSITLIERDRPKGG